MGAQQCGAPIERRGPKGGMVLVVSCRDLHVVSAFAVVGQIQAFLLLFVA
jgi:hypothetical protein